MGRTNLTRLYLLFELVYSAHFFTHTSLKCTLLGMVRRRQKDRINILLLSARNFARWRRQWRREWKVFHACVTFLASVHFFPSVIELRLQLVFFSSAYAHVHRSGTSIAHTHFFPRWFSPAFRNTWSFPFLSLVPLTSKKPGVVCIFVPHHVVSRFVSLSKISRGIKSWLGRFFLSHCSFPSVCLSLSQSSSFYDFQLSIFDFGIVSCVCALKHVNMLLGCSAVPALTSRKRVGILRRNK